MPNPTDLDHIEERAWQRANSADGLFDLVIGLSLLAMGVGAHLDQAWVGGTTFLLLLVTVRGLRQRLLAPRIGRATFGAARESRVRRLHLLLAALLAMISIVAVVAYRASAGDARTALGDHAGLIGFGLMLALIGATLGVVYRVTRAHLYAIAMLAIFSGGAMLAGPLPWRSMPTLLVAAGALISAGGVAVLVSFLHDNPVIDAAGPT